ncbi:choice-of-anchor L domain-containing protein [Chitinophagaceae bacterium MMS25-I14]
MSIAICSFSFNILGINAVNAQINVSGNKTAQELAAQLTGTGVTVLNPVLTCPSIANGTFKVVSSNLPLDSGIVLTTGRAETQQNYYGVNGLATYFASTNNGAPGDQQLSNVAGTTTFDACTLEFDLVPRGDSLSFGYVFSSEEYTSAVCGKYNDAFAFFISGPGITGQPNIAEVPGTNIPVTINSINNGIPSAGNTLSRCTAMGPGSPFTGYYTDNSSGTTLTHLGMTTLLTASAQVIPCSTYHLKIVIADGGNATYDSGVFLKGGSLNSTEYRIAASAPAGNTPQGLPYAVKACAPGRLMIKRSRVRPTPETVHYQIAGTAVNGYDYTSIADSVVIAANDSAAQILIHGLATPVNGPKTVKLLVKSAYHCGTSDIVDSASLVLLDTMHVQLLTPDTAICKGDKVDIRLAGDSLIQYNWSPSSGIDDIHSMQPVITPSATQQYQLTASWPGTGCTNQSAALNIRVNPLPQVSAGPDQSVCYDQQVQLESGASPVYSGYSYAWSGPDGFSSQLQNPVIAHANAHTQGTYIVVISIDTSSCHAAAATNIHVSIPDIPKVVSPFIMCEYQPAPALPVTGTGLMWYADSTGGTGSSIAPVVNTNGLGIYRYYVSQTVNGCESPRTGIEVEVKHCCDGVIFIPSAFTPNNDGINDIFRLKMGYGYTLARIIIYNRWGQAVYIGYNNNGWDGTFSGEPVEAGAYYYNIEITCIDGAHIEKKGDVTVIR